MLYRRQPSVQVGFILIQAQASILKVLKEKSLGSNLVPQTHLEAPTVEQAVGLHSKGQN